MGYYQNFDGTDDVNKERFGDNDVPTDSAHITFDSSLKEERCRCTHAHGQAEMGATL